MFQKRFLGMKAGLTVKLNGRKVRTSISGMLLFVTRDIVALDGKFRNSISKYTKKSTLQYRPHNSLICPYCQQNLKDYNSGNPSFNMANYLLLY